MAKAEAVQIILTEIDNDIYSTVDACPNACEMWRAIERLKQGKSINVQDLETNLFWEFGKFTSLDRESLESYYSRDGENLDKMKEKGDECIFVGYSTQSRAYRVFNKRTRVIMESICNTLKFTSMQRNTTLGCYFIIQTHESQ
nr:hypothetical protein [Tanacetum cinerariifolium]